MQVFSRNVDDANHFGVFRRYLLVSVCMVVVFCFLIGGDYYNARALTRKVKKTIAGASRTINYSDLVRERGKSHPFGLGSIKGVGRVDFTAPNAFFIGGADTCPGTNIGALPFNDTGTTVGFVDNYKLPPDTTSPTVTGCPTCTATGTGPAGSLPRGAVYTGTTVGPDVAYTVTFSSSNNSLNTTMTPTGGQDLSLVVYTNVCSNLPTDAIAVSDTGIANQAETVTISTMPAGTYNIVVDGYSAGGTPPGPSGPYSLAVTGSGTIASAHTQHVVDFNGDGKTDFSIVRNTGGGPSGQVTWITRLNGPGTYYGADWGLANDFFTPADFDGDGKTDIAVWRAGTAGTAAYYILQSATNTLRLDVFGQSGDDPSVVGDYDGDGKADVAVYRAGATAGAQSIWYYRGSLSNPGGNITYLPWGQNGDFPAPGDYDGDGKADVAIQRNNGGGQAIFWINQTTAGVTTVVFGTPTDVIVPGDYDGDGKTDIAVIRGIGGAINWFVRPSSTGAVSAIPYAVFGTSSTDFPTQGDFDGDGKTDVAIWRASATPGASAFWYNGSTSGVATVQFGANGDYPTANYNSH